MNIKFGGVGGAFAIAAIMIGLCPPWASAASATYYACVTNSTGAIEIVTSTTTCQTGQTKIHWYEVGPPGIYFSGTNLGTLTTTPTSILQPAPQISQQGSYMITANISIDGDSTGAYVVDTCYVQVGSTTFVPSVTSPQPGGSQYENLTATGAITLTKSQVPSDVSLICSTNYGSSQVIPSASISIMQVGSLQIGTAVKIPNR